MVSSVVYFEIINYNNILFNLKALESTIQKLLFKKKKKKKKRKLHAIYS